MRHLWTLLGLLLLLTPLAGAQQKASAEFHHRATDAGVELRIDIDIESGWHLGHTELGAPDAIGALTTVEIDTIGAAFDEVRFPEPHRTPQEYGARGRPTWIYSHSGQISLWAFGAWEDEADPEIDVWVTIEGQTCSDISGQCIPFEVELDSLGAGDEALWADFPDDLRVELEPVEEEDEPFTIGGGDEGGFGAFGSGFGSTFGGGSNGQMASGELFHHLDGETLTAVLAIDIVDGWHLYGTELGHPEAIGIPTTAVFSADGVAFDEPVFPEAHEAPQEILGEGVWAYTFDGRVLVAATGTVTGDFDPASLSVKVDGQTCSDADGTCILYGEELASAGDVPPADLLAVVAMLEAEPAGAVEPRSITERGPPAGDVDDGGDEDGDDLWAFILLCIGGGIFTLLMPCTYPMIPITISFFTKQAEAAHKPTIGLPIAYGLGIIAVFVIIGVAVGPFIITFATHWLTNAIIGLAFIYFAFVLLGMITLNPPRFLMNAAGTASQKGGLIGVFLMGTALVVTSFTCTAPILGSILSVGATEGNLPRLVLGMAVFGLTMAIPFVALSLVPGKLKAMPSSGEWMNTLKVTLGFVELAAAFKFLSNWDVAKQAGMLSDEMLLLLWIVILFVASAYLLGFVRIKGGADAISPGRALAGTAFLAATGYLVLVLFGYPRSELMHAFLPGYSAYGEGTTSSIASGARGAASAKHTIVTDDYDAALAQALAEDRLLLVNLTGFT